MMPGLTAISLRFSIELILESFSVFCMKVHRKSCMVVYLFLISILYLCKNSTVSTTRSVKRSTTIPEQ